jgi:hypothetical protein
MADKCSSRRGDPISSISGTGDLTQVYSLPKCPEFETVYLVKPMSRRGEKKTMSFLLSIKLAPPLVS